VSNEARSQRNCRALRRGPLLIGLPQRGQFQVAEAETVMSGSSAGHTESPEEPTNKRQCGRALRVGQETELADTNEAVRQDVLDIAAQKLVR
jgi:hypothetical protein